MNPIELIAGRESQYYWTAIARRAAALELLGLGTTRPWLRWINKPQRKSPLLPTLKGHSSYVWGLAFSRDGRRLVSASNDHTLKLWDAGSGVELATFAGHEKGVRVCAFSPDGARIASSSDDGTVKLWDTATGTELTTLPESASPSACDFFDDGRRLLTGSKYGFDLRVWDLERFVEIGSVKTGGAYALSPDGSRVVSTAGYYGEKLDLWDLNTLALVATIKHVETDGRVKVGFAFSPDGKLVASAWGGVKLWDAETGAEVGVLRDNHYSAQHCRFSFDGASLVSWSESAAEQVLVWDVGTRTRLALVKFTGFPHYADDVLFSPDGRLLAITQQPVEGSKIWLFDPKTGEQVAALPGSSPCVFSPDGSIIASKNGTAIEFLDSQYRADATQTARDHGEQAVPAAYSPDGSLLAGFDNKRLVNSVVLRILAR